MLNAVMLIVVLVGVAAPIEKEKTSPQKLNSLSTYNFNLKLVLKSEITFI
jgi:hypothetical protein